MQQESSAEGKSFSKDVYGLVASEFQDMTCETIKAMREESAIASEFTSHLAQAYSVNGWTSAVEAYWIHQADLYRRWCGRLIDHQRRLLQKIMDATDIAKSTHSEDKEAPPKQQAST